MRQEAALGCCVETDGNWWVGVFKLACCSCLELGHENWSQLAGLDAHWTFGAAGQQPGSGSSWRNLGINCPCQGGGFPPQSTAVWGLARTRSGHLNFCRRPRFPGLLPPFFNNRLFVSSWSAP